MNWCKNSRKERGSPLGLPEIDWFAAEKVIRAYLYSVRN